MAPHILTVREMYLNHISDRAVGAPTVGHSASHTKSISIGAAIAPMIGIILVVAVCLMPKRWMVNLYDWIRRGFKRKPTTKPSQNSSYVFFNAERRREAEERRRREKEEASKTFLQRHVEMLRAWKKPTKSEDTEALVTELRDVPAPPPIAQPPRYGRTYEGFQRYLKDQGPKKSALVDVQL